MVNEKDIRDIEEIHARSRQRCQLRRGTRGDDLIWCKSSTKPTSAHGLQCNYTEGTKLGRECAVPR
ncbi:hypothetical protein SERLA73DRAFT_145958 [Serpula lacrymans var. lacrymans S7.3]|uniref:Uncharacterized protein n=1 Tax=Serpula lacrymans var. lacrymans (strain S7.3) TaxID=936435 RepID=F8QEV4_SERL3|nr:hypothetical protein SERLA73DRAFT_145958 [Serpula lacrymans var. lacrymans S7.3]